MWIARLPILLLPASVGALLNARRNARRAPVAPGDGAGQNSSSSSRAADPDQECHTAIVGEQCYENVAAVMKFGIPSNPTLYRGLGNDSRLEDVQRYLHEAALPGLECPRPCAVASLGAPALFCFTTTRGAGYEPKLLETQLKNEAGIFACDGYAVLSETQFTLGRGPGGPVRTLYFPKSQGNASVFAKTWDAIKYGTVLSQYDWVVRVEPDVVLLPDRLRKHLAGEAGEHVYIKNCNASSVGSPTMYKALEAISRAAIQKYFDNDAQCKRDWSPDSFVEDQFLVQCMDRLRVSSVVNLGVLDDAYCRGDGLVNCTAESAAAFHPLKSPEAWEACWSTAAHWCEGGCEPRMAKFPLPTDA